MHTGRVVMTVVALLAASLGQMRVRAQVQTPQPLVAPPRAVTASPYISFDAPVVEALLYNPPVGEVVWSAPDKPGRTIRKVETVLLVYARGVPDAKYVIAYRIESAEGTLHTGLAEAEAASGLLEVAVTLPRPYAGAVRVAYELQAAGAPPIGGRAVLRWSRFRGRVRYLDERWRSTYMELWPNGFRAPGSFYVPVGDDGRFDALLPARVYSVVNVNGAGYKIDAMERWAWDYDLTRPREDTFTIGRTELYAMRAFDLNAPLPTVFVMFRPTALSRVLRFDTDGDGRISDDETRATIAEMKRSPTIIAPELEAGDVTVWLNGREEQIVRFDRVPEFDGDFWQIQYVLQIFPATRPPRGVWHEVKVEVRSREKLRGRDIDDFGQGSVGFQRY